MLTMRIIGGKYKGIIFNPPKNFTARPTTDVAKEALFNILANYYDFSGMKILDLFSGTGSIGYEFISRGAGEVTFVEKNFSHVKFIKKITGNLNFKNVNIINKDVFRYLKKCNGKFDIIFSDPPFDLQKLNQMPNAIIEAGILKDNGIFIVEHSKNHDFSTHPNFKELRKYGKVNFSFFIP